MYTEEVGRAAFIISGVRSKKAKVQAGLLQVMSVLDIVAYVRTGRGVQRISDIKPAVVYSGIPFDIRKSAVGLFMAELVLKTVKEQEKNADLFAFIKDSFVFLDTTQHSTSNIHIKFMLELAVWLGFRPGGMYDIATPVFDLKEGVFTADVPTHLSCVEGDLCQSLWQYIQCALTNCHTVKIAKQDRLQLLEKLVDFYRWHVSGFQGLNTMEVMREVF